MMSYGKRRKENLERSMRKQKMVLSSYLSAQLKDYLTLYTNITPIETKTILELLLCMVMKK